MVKRAKKAEAAEVREEEAEDVAPKKAKKMKKAAEVAVSEPVAENVNDDVEAVQPKKQKKKKAATVAAEPAEDHEAEDVAPVKKKKKKAAAAADAADESEAVQKTEKAAKADGEKDSSSATRTSESAPAQTTSNRASDDGSGKWKRDERDTENTVLVRGLPFSTTEETLSRDFGECGDMLSCRMLFNDAGQCRGVAFIKYATKACCDKAIEYDGTLYGGRTIYVAHAGDTGSKGGKGKKGKGKGKDKGKGGHDNENTVMIRGLPYSSTEKQLKSDFAECGEVSYIKMPLKEDGTCRGIAFITYATKAGFQAALDRDGMEYGGRTIHTSVAGAEEALPKDGKSKGKGKGERDNENTVFVRGLPFATTEEMLRKDFGECGEVVSCKMPLNEEGACRGIAFIKYADQEACNKAIEYDNTDYGGRTINVAMAGTGGKGKDGKGKGKDATAATSAEGQGEKPGERQEPTARSTGALVGSTGKKTRFEDSDDE
eukprot:TRINITY_DN11447_c1_g1_i1.p1 TRINITY_DN11447_c1_g1~~TRINITY_DN11447_c1_g1_i1.p1  ORF type:complete len:487 (+),score=126.71 TRINITY_DN11447_c1_g1_i1:56-1516(+)